MSSRSRRRRGPLEAHGSTGGGSICAKALCLSGHIAGGQETEVRASTSPRKQPPRPRRETLVDRLPFSPFVSLPSLPSRHLYARISFLPKRPLNRRETDRPMLAIVCVWGAVVVRAGQRAARKKKR